MSFQLEHCNIDLTGIKLSYKKRMVTDVVCYDYTVPLSAYEFHLV